jgi:hypothetical protein
VGPCRPVRGDARPGRSAVSVRVDPYGLAKAPPVAEAVHEILRPDSLEYREPEMIDRRFVGNRDRINTIFV